ncbi:GDSL-type esterase/lipase family protein [Bacteroidales bacterium OttesenSCG-928-J19]|nr:GDSL-type esterase/lipase family protein [Bacteroidales bacterium OttesenSCG-928-J19]
MRKLLLSLTLFLVCIPLSADTNNSPFVAIPIENYPFIDLKHNEIRIPSEDSTVFRDFFDQVNDLITRKDRQINVLHIGGSHVQADMFSHKVRSNLDVINAQFGSPRGFIFPFSAAKTNNPFNYRVTYSGEWNAVRNVQANREIALGMGGIAVYTNDITAKIHIDLNPNRGETGIRWTLERLRLLGYPEDEYSLIYPVLLYQGDTIRSFYDLITDTYVFELPEEVDSFELGFTSTEEEPGIFIVNGFIPEKDVPGIIYHAIGVNGASTESFLNVEYFEKELSIIMPDLVIFGIGINDAANNDFSPELFHARYTELLRRIREINPNCAFLFLTNNDSFKRLSRNNYRVNQNVIPAQEVFYRLARETGGGVWDLFELMGGLSSMARWEKAGLAQKDKIHFKKEGYELLGDLLFNALLRLYYEMEGDN